jgi:hypothetical protein
MNISSDFIIPVFGLHVTTLMTEIRAHLCEIQMFALISATGVQRKEEKVTEKAVFICVD